jgi:hypothetical protein
MMILVSLIFPSTTRSIAIPQTDTERPVAATPQEFRSIGAAPNKSADDLVTFFDLLFDRPMHVRKRHEKAAQDVFHTTESRALSGKWSLLKDVFVKILSGGLDIAVIEHIIDELAHQVGVVFHLRGNHFPSYCFSVTGSRGAMVIV